MSIQQPEALDLADWLDGVSEGVSGRKAAARAKMKGGAS